MTWDLNTLFHSVKNFRDNCNPVLKGGWLFVQWALCMHTGL